MLIRKLSIECGPTGREFELVVEKRPMGLVHIIIYDAGGNTVYSSTLSKSECLMISHFFDRMVQEPNVPDRN